MFKPGALLKVNIDNCQSIRAIPLSKVDPFYHDNLRTLATLYYDPYSRKNMDKDFEISASEPPVLYLGYAHLPPFQPIGAFPSAFEREYYIHKLLHKGEIWVVICLHQHTIQTFLSEVSAPDLKNSVQKETI